MRRLLAVVALAGAALGCTPEQRAAWLVWHAQDPDAAVAFLDTPEGRALVEAPAVELEVRASRYGSAVWDRIARCESGGDWTLRATNRTGSYGGGLMIRDGVWRDYGGREYAPTADRATRAQQIAVAERIADDVGLDDAWQCYP